MGVESKKMKHILIAILVTTLRSVTAFVPVTQAKTGFALDAIIVSLKNLHSRVLCIVFFGIKSIFLYIPNL